MPKPARNLPYYDNPPVIETLLGVQYSLAKPISNRVFGEYWQRIIARYPHMEIQDPIAPVIEEFERPTNVAFPRVQLVPQGDVRYWFIDPSETRLVQLQRDRFLHNWRRITNEPYPHYENIKPGFEREWIEFCSFLSEKGYEKPEITQCEVTYVNHIEIGDQWKGFAEPNKVIACWRDTSGKFLTQPESVSLNVRYTMPEKKGRLHITAQPVIRRLDAKELLQLNLTARGKPESSNLQDISEWFDLAHEWIVQGFTDFTTAQMHEAWKRKR